MKILLLGEYSGLFNSLKEGLQELGHDVTLISDGDGFKKYPSDYNWRIEGLGMLNGYATIVKGISFIPKFTGYDIVYVISPAILFSKFRFRYFLFKYLKKYNHKVFLCGAGMTAHVFKYWYDKKGSKYNSYVNGYLDDVGGDINKVDLYLKKYRDEEDFIMSQIDGYIPIMYEYAAPFINHPKYRETIPIPINWKRYKYEPNKVNGKIRVFHGLTKTCKGGKYILESFDELSKKFENVDFIAKGNIPFNEYIPFLKTMNIVVDDANAYSLGMNALFSMTMGKIVLGGAEPKGNSILQYKLQNPAYNIVSSVDSISTTIESLIENKSGFEELGEKAHIFVRSEHDYVKIAERYIDIWKK